MRCAEVDMRKIAITIPEFFGSEPLEIARLLTREGFWRVHIRKPGATAEQVSQLIEAIPAELYPRLSLHDHFELAVKYGLGGVHLNSRNPEAPEQWKGLTSKSLHAVDEIGSCFCDYAFLSPIYPSISKPGYKGCFDFDELKKAGLGNIFALGGVTPSKFDELENIGFGGAAMLGDVWRARVDMDNFKLQYITHPVEGESITETTEKVLRGGCRWVQLRHKEADADTLLREAKGLRELCDRYGATFIIDDHVEMVAESGADGVHLGKNDMPVQQARAIVGPRRIIGATANTYDDIAKAAADGTDYIGLGPYRFTTTKAKLSPVLGVEGYSGIVARCRENGLTLPIVAIGGIERDDVAAIMATGVNGIAVSGCLRNAPDSAAETKAIIQALGDRL